MDRVYDRLIRFNRLLSPEAYEVVKGSPGILDSLILHLESGREMPMIISRSDLLEMPNGETKETIVGKEEKAGSREDHEVLGGIIGSFKDDSGPSLRRESRIHQDRLKTAKPKFETIQKRTGSLIKPDISSVDQTQVYLTGKRSIASEMESDLRIIYDPVSEMGTRGKIEDFTKLFQNRYSGLREILRIQYPDLLPTEDIGTLGTSPDSVRMIGMLESIRFTKNGHVMATLEDPTGSIRFLIHKNRGDLFRLNLVEDEVVGVVGKYKPGERGDGGIVFADQVFKADIPGVHRRRLSEDRGVIAAFISDIHIGSRMFLEKEWKRMTDWLNGEGKGSLSSDMAGRVKYMVIAGDLVDGIGVYPDQEADLVAPDISHQYEMLAEAMSRIPDHITIVMMPGNHDAVRIAEPQPPLPVEYQEMFTNESICFLSNPSFFSLSGVHVAAYHGKSLDDLVQLFQNVSYEDPIPGMVEMLKFRHFSPTYGMRNQLAPELKDHLLIKDIPDILVSGHVHRFGYDTYKGVQMIQAGTWQSQTPYQKMLNFKPQPAKMALVELDRPDKYHVWEIT